MIKPGKGWKTRSLFFLFIFSCISTLQMMAQDNLEYRRNILPPVVAESLKPSKILDALKWHPTRDEVLPVFVMINPGLLPLDEEGGLSREEKLQNLIKSWAPEENRLDDVTILALSRCEEQLPPTICRALQDVGKQFFELFCSSKNVVLINYLKDMIEMPVYKMYKSLIVATFDVRCRAKPGTGKSRIEVDLYLKLWRVTINRDVSAYPIERVEMLFSDQALGEASLPTPPKAGVTDLFTSQVKKEFEQALIQALKNKIALSFWCNPKVLAVPRDGGENASNPRSYLSWIYGEREQIVEPSLTWKY
ncbi:MAG: hypothetical protein ABIK28_08615 [Planctomycetota bacterium]